MKFNVLHRVDCILLENAQNRRDIIETLDIELGVDSSLMRTRPIISARLNRLTIDGHRPRNSAHAQHVDISHDYIYLNTKRGDDVKRLIHSNLKKIIFYNA